MIWLLCQVAVVNRIFVNKNSDEFDTHRYFYLTYLVINYRLPYSIDPPIAGINCFPFPQLYPHGIANQAKSFSIG